jgi:hypothetical protein
MKLQDKGLYEPEVWVCELCNNDFFLLDKAILACSSCGNTDTQTLRIKEDQDDERELEGNELPGQGLLV